MDTSVTWNWNLKVFVATRLHLPLRLTPEPPSIAAHTAHLTDNQVFTLRQDRYAHAASSSINTDGSIVDEYHITKLDMAQVLVSLHPYNNAFDEELYLQKFHHFAKQDGRFKFKELNG